MAFEGFAGKAVYAAFGITALCATTGSEPTRSDATPRYSRPGTASRKADADPLRSARAAATPGRDETRSDSTGFATQPHAARACSVSTPVRKISPTETETATLPTAGGTTIACRAAAAAPPPSKSRPVTVFAPYPYIASPAFSARMASAAPRSAAIPFHDQGLSNPSFSRMRVNARDS